ncbi:MAG: hypothetical protein E7422_01370 [Ruminococcaceae bacterium]|nr:hypothetical protein [Oscillospiraceae bacterium]
MNKISAYSAILAAIEYARLNEENASNINVRHTDGLYEIQFDSDWTQYDCFVDEHDGEVLGFDCRPLPEHVMLAGESSRAIA